MSYNFPSLEQTTATLGSQNIGVQPGDDLNTIINAVFTNGGGTVYFNSGTYTLTEDVILPAGVTLEGNSRDNVILDGDGQYGVIITADLYNTGTLSINNGDTQITGVGTTFTVDMVGQFVFLNQLWWEITGFVSTTKLNITTYAGPNISGGDVIISPVNRAATIRTLTIANTVNTGLLIEQSQEAFLDNIIIYDCGTGINMKNSVYSKWLIGANYCDYNAIIDNSSGFELNYSDFSFALVGAGVSFNKCSFSTIIDSASDGNVGNGWELTDCQTLTFISNGAGTNGTNGVELISGNRACQFFGTECSGNTNSGYKLTDTADNIVINGCPVYDNGDYGIEIANANCDDNILIGVTTSGNGTAGLLDNGTGTLSSATVNVIL